MNIQLAQDPPQTIAADAVVVGLFSDAPPEGPAADVDKATGGLLTRLIEADELDRKLGQTTPLLGPRGIKARLALVVGLGSREKFAAGEAYRAAAAASRALSAKKRAGVAFYLGDSLSAAQQENLVAGAIVGCQGQDLYRKEKDRHPFETLQFGGVAQAALDAGAIIGGAMNLTRRLINEPPQAIYPASFALQAQQVGQECGLTVEVWDKPRLERERCGALLAVGCGSAREPRLVIARHRGGGGDAPTLALVGKGVTFDSGGLSLKPSDSMITMKADMSGAATVLGVMRAIADLKLPINVTAYMGLAENMTGADAYKLGDVLTARNGTTIEVHNTDAEGRLVLADVLSVAADDKPERIIDLATLTGACVVALGQDVAGLMTNEQAWCDRVAAAADACGERVWQLPMFEEFGEQIRGTVADIKNVGNGRWGGAITAAKFLEQFVAGRPWTHIDIAGPAFAEKPKPWADLGATGCMVRTLVHLLRQ